MDAPAIWYRVGNKEIRCWLNTSPQTHREKRKSAEQTSFSGPTILLFMGGEGISGIGHKVCSRYSYSHQLDNWTYCDHVRMLRTRF
jgi:hypothetical protein